MSISDKTRKILWAKSGNKCAMCNQELVADIADKHTIYGMECHIVSQKENGPRHRQLENYDDENNLILLCANHHKLIDDNPGIYTEEILKKIKNNHINLQSNTQKKLLLIKLEHTRDLIRTLRYADQYVTDYPQEKEGDYDLFREFFDMVHNFDVLEDYDEFDLIKKFKPIVTKILNKNYIILLGREGNYGKYKLDSAIVFIRNKPEN